METLNKLTNLVYQAALNSDWHSFLNELMTATHSNIGWLIMTDQHSSSPFFSEFISTEDGFDHDLFLNQYMPRIAEDPFYVHSLDQTESACFRGSDIVSTEKLPSYSLYPLFEQAGCEHVLATIPVRDNDLNSFTVMNRHKFKEDYSAEDVRLMEMMTPHINRAFHLHNLLLRQQQQISLYQAILEKNPNALILLDDKLNLKITNNAASHLLQNQSILLERNGKLSCKNASHFNQVKEFVGATMAWIQAKAPDPLSIQLRDDEDALRLTAYPVHAESDFNNYTDMCCVIEITTSRQPDWSRVSQDLDLTPKELRTVKLLYSGMDLHGIAAHAHVSFNTVKSQLMAVYRKTNFNSQRELMANLIQYI